MQIVVLNKYELHTVKPLWEKLNAYHLEKTTRFKKHYSESTFEKRIESLMKRDKLMVFVTRENDQNVGYCITTIEGSNGEIDSIFVEQACRGKKLGELLMNYALRWLNEQRCETIRVAIAQGNEDVLDFYRRFGFTERLTVMQQLSTESCRALE